MKILLILLNWVLSGLLTGIIVGGITFFIKTNDHPHAVIPTWLYLGGVAFISGALGGLLHQVYRWVKTNNSLNFTQTLGINIGIGLLIVGLLVVGFGVYVKRQL